MPDLTWWQVAVPAVAAYLLLMQNLALRHQRLRFWEKSAKAVCRDNQVKISGFHTWRRKLTARSGPNHVRITDARGRSKAVVVEIEGPWSLSGVKLSRQRSTARVQEIEIGDERFDEQLVVEGPALAVGARLDQVTRRRILSAASGCTSLEIGAGGLRAELPEEKLRRILPILLDIGRRFAEPVPIERRIARNVRRDRVAGARLFNLRLLARERPGEPETLEVLRDACSDESPAVRVRAAIELGDEGRDILLRMVEKSVSDEAVSQAVAHLGRTLPFDRLKKVLARSLHNGLPQTARASLEELGHRQAEGAGVLARVMAEETGELAIAAARALGATGEASAEPALLQALQSEDSTLREAAVTALGHAGTATAVQPLQEAAERSWLDLSLRRAARRAIAEIQSRLEGASPGQLSLAGAEGGQLALATDDAGQLTLAADGAGELAVAPHAVETEQSGSTFREEAGAASRKVLTPDPSPISQPPIPGRGAPPPKGR